MIIKEGVDLSGLKLVMVNILPDLERIWIGHGREEGVTITAALDGAHRVGSKHYEGLALDLRTYYWTEEEQEMVYNNLLAVINLLYCDDFDVVLHKTHIHIEYDPKDNTKE